MTSKMNDKKTSDKVGVAIALIWIVGAMHAALFVIRDIWGSIYGYISGSFEPHFLSILLPICFFGIPGLLLQSGDSSPGIGKRLKTGIICVCSFYAATFVITGLIDGFYMLYKILKYAESNYVSTLVWLERGLDISVTWIGLRNLFSEIPAFLTFVVLGVAGLYLCVCWNIRE